LFERGFKSWCEELSLKLRKDLGLRPIDPIDPWRLAEHLMITVRTTAEFAELDSNDKVLLEKDSAWSAVTLEVAGRKLVILKATNSPGRQSSDLTHEIAHQLLDHKATGVGHSVGGHLMVHAFSKLEEDEADWLSASLLLPRSALMHIKKHFRDDDIQAAKAYKVSVAMLKYRMGVTGVNFQMRRNSR
jgi:hypothetical protein